MIGIVSRHPLARRYPPALGPVLLAAALLSCDEPTQPGQDSLRVLLDFSAVGAPTLSGAGDDWPQVRCDATLRARTVGTATTGWLGATLRYFVGQDSLSPASTEEWPVEQLASVLGDSLAPGPDRVRPWPISYPWPFSFELELRYRSAEDTEPRAARARARCAPPVPPSYAGPAIEVLAIEFSDPVLDPGDTVSVTYRASATVGLWTTAVSITGAFERWPVRWERLSQTKTRTEHIEVPWHSRLDREIVVRVIAEDAVLMQAEAESRTGVFLQDVRPPAVVVGVPIPVQLGTDDSARFDVAYDDDNRVDWIIWEITGPVSRRDSLDVRGGPPRDVRTVAVPMEAALAGQPFSITVWARDAVGHLSASGTIPAGTFSVFESVALPVSSILTVERGLVDLVYDPRRQQLHFTGSFPGYFGTIDLTTHALLPSLSLPDGALGVDLTAGGDSALVAQPTSNTLSVIDLANRVVRAPITLSLLGAPTDGSPRPLAVRVAANGKALVRLSSGLPGGQHMLTLDPATGVQAARTTVGGGTVDFDGWHARSRGTWDRDRIVFVSSDCRWAYDSSTDAFSACAGPPYGLSEILDVSAPGAGRRIAAGRDVFAPDLSLVSRIPFVRTVMAPDDDHVLALLGRYVIRVRVSDGGVVRGARLPVDGYRLLLLPDQRTLLVLQANGNLVRVDISDL